MSRRSFGLRSSPSLIFCECAWIDKHFRCVNARISCALASMNDVNCSVKCSVLEKTRNRVPCPKEKQYVLLFDKLNKFAFVFVSSCQRLQFLILFLVILSYAEAQSWLKFNRILNFFCPDLLCMAQ